MEFVVPYAMLLLVALAWAAKAYGRWFLVIGWKRPGLVQVGLEVALFSGLGIALPFATLEESKEAGGVIAATFWGGVTGMAALGAAWPGIRAAGRGMAYVAAQGMIASLFFFLPLLAFGYTWDRLPPPPDAGPLYGEGAAINTFGLVVLMLGFFGPLFPVVALIAGVATKGVRSLRAGQETPSS